MPGAAFYIALNMDIAAGWVIAVLLIIRLIRRTPRRLIYPMWAVALFRLACPFSISAPWSAFRLAGGLVRRLVPAEAIAAFLTGTEDVTMMNMVGAANRYAPIAFRTEALRHAFAACAVMWAAVAIALLLGALALYALARSRLRGAERIRDNLYLSPLPISPTLVGIFRPKVMLPAGLEPDSVEGRMVLAHEEVHRRRLDNLWRALAIGLACVHWYNPLIWVMLGAFITDMERSCDEAVLRQGRYGEQERKRYASALLRFAEAERTATSAGFGRSNVRARIVRVLNYRKASTAGAVASALLLAAVALALMLNATGG